MEVPQTGNGEYFRRAFHPESKLFAVRDGKFRQLPSSDYAAAAPVRPALDEAQRVPGYPRVKFTDYMTLLKVDGGWRIIDKAFHAEPKK